MHVVCCHYVAMSEGFWRMRVVGCRDVAMVRIMGMGVVGCRDVAMMEGIGSVAVVVAENLMFLGMGVSVVEMRLVSFVVDSMAEG